MQFIHNTFPNVVKYWKYFVEAIGETLVIVGISIVLIIAIGLLLGILLVIIDDGGICENKILNAIVPKIINIIRAVPFVILLTLLMPVTRAIVGTAIGIKGAIVPLVVCLSPFVARQMEVTLHDVDPGVIEMARAFGYSKPYIIFRILLKEAREGIIRVTITSAISLVNTSTMAGVIGGGGIGDFAIRYGYTRMMTDITWVSVIVLLVLIFAIQGVGNLVLKKLSTN